MQDCKLVKVPVFVGTKCTKLAAIQCPKSEKEIENMACIPYSNVVGSLMYAMVSTRPNIAHEVGVLSIYMSTREHWKVVRRVFIYLHDMIDLAIYYHENSEEVGVHGFIDSDWDGDIYDRRSTSGYMFTLFGGVISWMSRKHSVVSLSTIEVEYIASTHASKEAVWMQKLCTDIGFGQQVVRLSCDS